MKQVVYMAVIADKFELPIAFADNQRALSRRMKIDPAIISKSYRHGTQFKILDGGKRKRARVISVEINIREGE